MNTAKSGYIQRRIVKLTEDIKVEYDGSVRDTFGKVYQMAYGEDYIDPTKMVKVNGKKEFCDVGRLTESLNLKYEILMKKNKTKKKDKKKDKKEDKKKDKKEDKKKDKKKENKESQKNGFVWENEIRENVFGLERECNNTDKYDISCEKNNFNDKENISIKTTGNYTLDCGDILSFYNYDFDKKNTIIVVKYLQKGDNKEIEEIYEIDYNKELHGILFGDVPEEVLKKYVESVKSIPKNVRLKEEEKVYKKLKKEIQKKYNMKISISPKVDSKSQRRVQCSITNFKKYTKFIEYNSKDNIIRGKTISKSIFSTTRVRSKK